MFLARHGYGHTHRAARDQLPRQPLGAARTRASTRVVVGRHVGGIRDDLGAGRARACPHQIIDYTWGRASTFFEGAGQPVTHIDFTEPYSRALRERMLAGRGGAAASAVVDGGVYAATQGPRLETAAEIDRLERDGADAGRHDRHAGSGARARARPARTPRIAVVANHAAGRGDSARAMSLDEIAARARGGAWARVRRIIEKLVRAA